MRRITRIERSVDLLRPRTIASRSSPYLCSACNHQASSFSTSASRSADKKLPFTERIRQKIWGTDQPPGLEDPYGDASVFDQTKKRAAVEKKESAESAAEPALPDDYEPASTWDGLLRVGGYGHWWSENWDPDHQFTGFLPRKRTTDSEVVVAALHRAMVEVFALQQAQKPLSGVSKNISEWDPTDYVQIVPSGNGATLQFSSQASIDDILQSLDPVDETAVKKAPTESEADVAADRSTVDPLNPDMEPEVEDETSVKKAPTESEADVAADRSRVDPLPRGSQKPSNSETAEKEKSTASEKDVDADKTGDDPLSPFFQAKTYAEVIATWDPAWLGVSLENPEVKFAVLKRTMQLTGIRIPDPVIKSANTAQALLRHLIAPPKPRKLAQALVQEQGLNRFPNVKIYGKRRTPVDKERSVGRWKVIEKELKERGLPVFGREELAVRGMPLFGRNR